MLTLWALSLTQMTDFPTLSYGCCLFPLHPLYIPRRTSGGVRGGGGELKKGYTLVFAIPDIHPISGDPVAQLFLLSTF